MYTPRSFLLNCHVSYTLRRWHDKNMICQRGQLWKQNHAISKPQKFVITDTLHNFLLWTWNCNQVNISGNFSIYRSFRRPLVSKQIFSDLKNSIDPIKIRQLIYKSSSKNQQKVKETFHTHKKRSSRIKLVLRIFLPQLILTCAQQRQELIYES